MFVFAIRIAGNTSSNPSPGAAFDAPVERDAATGRRYLEGKAKQVRCHGRVLDLGDQVSLCQRDERLFVLESKLNSLQSSQKATSRFTDAQFLRVAEALVQKTKAETVLRGSVALT
jgi:hypothetical protein